MNLDRIENENLKTQIKEAKEKYLMKESELCNQINKLKNQLKIINLDKAYTAKPEPEINTETKMNEDPNQVQESKEYTCKYCEYKTNWMSYLKTHQEKEKKNMKCSSSVLSFKLSYFLSYTPWNSP